MKKSTIINLLSILSVIAILISINLAYLHFAQPKDSFCNLSEELNCDKVNQSTYSVFPPGIGIPNSIIGIFNFIVILIALVLLKTDKTPTILGESITKKEIEDFIFYILIANLLFALYLVYIEAFILYTFCILCIALDVIIIISLILSYKLRKTESLLVT